jgi:pilus assembly protein CpaF
LLFTFCLDHIIIMALADQTDYDRLYRIAREMIQRISTDPKLAILEKEIKLTRDIQTRNYDCKRLNDSILPKLPEWQLNFSLEDLPEIISTIYDEFVHLGPLGPLWRDDSVTEILVDSWDKVYVEVDGLLKSTKVRFKNTEHCIAIAKALALLSSDRALNRNTPLVTAQLPEARANFAVAPVATSGIAISIRKFKPLFNSSKLIQLHSVTKEMLEFLADAVVARATMLVSGGTGSGKTTLINVLSEFIPQTERIITIEDNGELRLNNNFVVSLITKESASGDDLISIDQDALMRNALRMRPDRIIVGEIRDAKAATTMLWAATTGHDGTMTTIHANNVASAVNNTLSNFIRAGSGVSDSIAKNQIVEAFDVVLQATRRRKKRFVSEIAEISRNCIVDDHIEPRVIFEANYNDDTSGEFSLKRVGSIAKTGVLAEKMREAGIDPTRWTA